MKRKPTLSSHCEYEELLKEFHPALNELNLSDFNYSSKIKVWWMCEKNNHEWQESIYNRIYFKYGCPYCSNHRVCLSNCLATTHKEIAAYWHPTKNNGLTPFDITFGSRKKVWWLCENNEHGWKTTISNRIKYKCPYCSSKTPKKSPSKSKRILAIIRPDLISEWHPIKNLSLTPFDVTVGSSKKVWWLCEKNGHEWQSKILHRTITNSGCPYCTNKKVAQSNCLAVLHPNISCSWHPTKNLDLTPFDVVAGTDKKVWWVCESCKHEWETSVRGRTIKGSGCPSCLESNGEKRVEIILNEIKINYEIQKRFDKCKNIKKLSFDFYLPQYNALIEYDGEQHFKSMDFFGGNKSFVETQKRDKIKNSFTLENNIPLLRIPYTKFDSIEEEIRSFVAKLVKI